jgi:DNA-binding NtrC family response regulator
MIPRLLVIDDDPAIRESLAEALGDGLAELRLSSSAEEALSMFGDFGPDVVLSDIRMPGMDGLELLKLIRERAAHVDVILMTAFDDMATIVGAMREGACEFLVKPVDLHDLRRVLARVLEDRRTRDVARRASANDGSAYRIDQLIGHDPRMIDLFKLVGQAAGSRANVLIRGESGTGKELIARAIHFNSAEADEPFVPVNCTALPSGLLESELFGHVKGSFTGAIGNRRGRFALAGRGSIFLDEIGDTSPEFQAKLLRVLEDRQLYPVGAEQPELTEARVISATHRNLEDMVRAGQFRGDLYYRRQIVQITLPPLRERMGDLPHLAHHLVSRANKILGRAAPAVLSQDAMDALLARDWPGNVRELENCLTRAVVMASGQVIRPEHLRLASAPQTNGHALLTLAELEKQHVIRVLAATQGHKSNAADILGVSRPRLDRMIRKYGVD